MCGTPGIKLPSFYNLFKDFALTDTSLERTGFAACALVYSLLTYLAPRNYRFMHQHELRASFVA